MDSQKKGLSVGQAAKSAGISTQSLQYYLMVGLIKPAQTTKTGRRLFDKESVSRIKLIRKLNNTGYPLREIRELFLERRMDLKGKTK